MKTLLPSEKNIDEEIFEFLSSTSLFAAIDGHEGSFCANFVAENLARLVVTSKGLKTATSTEDRLTGTMSEVFESLETTFENFADQRQDVSGASVVIAMYNQGCLCVGNVGDCLGVLCDANQKVHVLSKLHRVKVAKECQRVEQAGGFIFKGRIHGKILTSRTIGDVDIKRAVPGAVLSEPTISVFHVEKRHTCFPLLILGTKGLWDVLTPKKAFKTAKSGYKLWLENNKSDDTNPALEICHTALAAGGGADSITTVLVRL